MSDFLTRLAQRQLGQMASVEARVPELYATSVAAPPPTIVEDVPAAVIDNRESSAAPAPAVSPTSRQNRAMAVPDKTELETPPKYSAQSFVTAKRETALVSPAVENHGAEPPTFVPPTVLVAPRSIPSAPRESTPERRASPTAAAETSVIDSLLSPVAEPTPIITTEVLVPVAPPRFDLKTSSRKESAAPRHQTDVAEHSVEVTIGCIEVTALSAASAERRASKPRKASMSLEDYLARRQGSPRE
jgi:hypothetical protein